MDSDYIASALEALAYWLAQETGLVALFDPQPVKGAEPHARLTLVGTEDRGDGPIDVKFQLNVIGAGDGPDVFLPSVIGASCRVNDLYNPCLHEGRRTTGILTKEGTALQVGFPAFSDATGQFVQNEANEGETGMWRYVYTEPHYITLTIPRQQG